MNECILGIICVTKDDPIGIKNTLLSICKINSNLIMSIEVIIVNGGSRINDEILSYLNNKNIKYKIINGQDRSLYHAMNIGIFKSRGKLLWMLNGGDTCTEHSLSANFYADLKEQITQNKICVYQTITVDGYLSYSDYAKNRFVHQGIIYPKNVHYKYGGYIEWKKFTAADFLFFYQVFKDSSILVENSNEVIAELDYAGISSGVKHYITRDISLFLEENKSIFYLIIIILKTYFYFSLKYLIKKIFPKFSIKKMRSLI